MSTKAEVILDQIRSLAVKDQKDLWQELGRRIGRTPPAPAIEQHGEPLTDEDIEQSARVAFQALDEESSLAG